MPRLKTVARFVAFRGKFKSGTVRPVAFRGQILPRSWHSVVYWRVVVGIPQYVWVRFAKKLFLLWQSAAFDRGTAKDWIPAPAILHREPPCLLCHKFLTHDFPGVSHIRGELFTVGLNYTPRASVDTPSCILWHYPFNFLARTYSYTVWTHREFYLLCSPIKSKALMSAVRHKRDSFTRFSTPGFFHETITPIAIDNTPKYFGILFWIRRDIRL
jgi:hypothetical protein